MSIERSSTKVRSGKKDGSEKQEEVATKERRPFGAGLKEHLIFLPKNLIVGKNEVPPDLTESWSKQKEITVSTDKNGHFRKKTDDGALKVDD